MILTESQSILMTFIFVFVIFIKAVDEDLTDRVTIVQCVG